MSIFAFFGPDFYRIINDRNPKEEILIYVQVCKTWLTGFLPYLSILPPIYHLPSYSFIFNPNLVGKPLCKTFTPDYLIKHLDLYRKLRKYHFRQYEKLKRVICAARLLQRDFHIEEKFSITALDKLDDEHFPIHWEYDATLCHILPMFGKEKCYICEGTKGKRRLNPNWQ